MEGTENFSNYANINPTGIVVSSLPVRIEDWEIFNSHTVPQWVRLYNKGDTLPTAADDTALVDGLPVLIKRLLVPALSGENLADLNIHFTKGLSIRGTLSQADGSNDAPVAPITVNIGYKKL